MDQSRPGAPIKVLLADDQELVRAGFKVLLDVEDDISVVGEAADGTQAVELTRVTRPDVVLMDIRMPVLDGLQATRQIAAVRGLERVRVLILTTYDTDAYVFEALQAGASGFLLKDSGPAELLHAIRVVAAGEALLAPRITRRLIAQFTATRTAHEVAEDRLAVLTQREREVLALVGEGSATARSPHGWCSARPPPGPTSAGPWSSFVPATARSWSWWPTRPDWSAPARPPDHPASAHRTHRPAALVAWPT
jgi:DNA-binding NarL/FixJ family response regulator